MWFEPRDQVTWHLCGGMPKQRRRGEVERSRKTGVGEARGVVKTEDSTSKMIFDDGMTRAST